MLYAIIAAISVIVFNRVDGVLKATYFQSIITKMLRNLTRLMNRNKTIVVRLKLQRCTGGLS